jgi:parallel beta-helix repeat protein
MLTRFTVLGCALALLLALLPSGAIASHVSCGDVITQDTTLDSDLVNCPGDGVVIGASNITLDLAGHTIDGTGPDAGSQGVDNVGADGLVVTNGRIQEFQFGVSIRNADEGSVTGVVFSRCGSGVYLDEASGNRIEANRFFASATGVTLFRDGDFNRIADNSIVGADTALFIAGFTREPDLPVGNTVSGNDARDSSVGVFIAGAGSTLVSGNTLVGSGDTGISVALSDFTRVENNRIVRGNIGIRVTSSDETVVLSNRVDNNAVDGISIAESSVGTTTVEGNTANGNGDDGIDVDDPGTVITRNKANNNADLGIEAVPGVIDGGGNKASANGNPAQCVNVSCK